MCYNRVVGEVAARRVTFSGAWFGCSFRPPRRSPLNRNLAAGVDLVLAAGVTGDYADTDGASVSTYDALATAVRSGRLARATVQSAYSRVLALKARITA